MSANDMPDTVLGPLHILLLVYTEISLWFGSYLHFVDKETGSESGQDLSKLPVLVSSRVLSSWALSPLGVCSWRGRSGRYRLCKEPALFPLSFADE